MNRLVWKLLCRHLSFGQLFGFFVANLLGMSIVLLSLQFYFDVAPVFVQGDSFMKPACLVVGKHVSAVQTLQGGVPSFSAAEIEDFQRQPFVRSIGCFTPAQFDVYASVGSAEMGMGFGTDMFFEALPDRFVDADLSRWQYVAGSDSLPVILPRNYLNLYNFGFAGPKGLPALSEGLVGMVGLDFRLRGTQGVRRMYGRVVAFSDRLNTILVPQEFMDEANSALSPDRKPSISRLIVEVRQPADERIATYLQEHRYEEEGDAADGGRMAYFLRLVVGLVLVVGLIICALSFYVLLLSIYLLLQKHTEKIDILLLLGYTPRAVSLPFQLLSGSLNLAVWLLAMAGVSALRGIYLPLLESVYPRLGAGSLWVTFAAGGMLFFLVTLLDAAAVGRKVKKIWYIHRG